MLLDDSAPVCTYWSHLARLESILALTFARQLSHFCIVAVYTEISGVYSDIPFARHDALRLRLRPSFRQRFVNIVAI